MSDDVIRYTEPVYTERSDDGIATRGSANGQETDWSGWEKWMQGHLAIERQAILDGVADAVGDCLGERDQEIRELQLKIAELSGAVNVLRTGKSLRVRGTFDADARYEQFDIVAVNGSSFVATEDCPGPCPGEGWRLLASAGSRGARGFPGPRGEQGERGESAPAATGFKSLHLDRARYAILLSTQDGKIHELSLRGLFEQFVSDMKGTR
jgi:hypothetical protein